MMNNGINHELYTVNYLSESNAIVFSGVIELNGRDDFRPIIDFLESVFNEVGTTINIHFNELLVLNSSGQGQLYRYFIEKHESVSFSLSISGAMDSNWQQKFLPNIKKLIPGTRLYFK